MNMIAILDTETTDLDPKKGQAIEVAALLYNVQDACVIEGFSALMYAEENPAERINRIPANALRYARTAASVWPQVIGFISDGAEAIVAHRAEFDQSFVPETLRTFRPWICSKFDLEWPMQDKPGQSLVSLALAHGLGVGHAHRAMTDCELIARLLTRVHEMGHDLEPLLARGLRPKAEVISLAPFAEKEVVKEHGFRWDPDRKVWWRKMAIEDVAALPFKTRIGGAA